MSDRLHEILGEISILHKQMIETQKIKDATLVLDELQSYESDVAEHYTNLLLQYYFQENELSNLKELLLIGARFDMRFSDVKDAFLKINSNDENVIEFMEESIIFLKDTMLDNALNQMYNYYMNNPKLQSSLEQAVELIKRNRYVCAHCYKYKNKKESQFFLNEDLLESLKRDLPYLLK